MEIDAALESRIGELYNYTSTEEHAAFLLPGGKMMNACGAKDGGHICHHSMGIILDMEGAKAVREFLEAGAIRQVCGHGALEMRQEPTPEQYEHLGRLFFVRRGDITLDMYHGGKSSHLGYPIGTTPYQIMTDIREFFAV